MVSRPIIPNSSPAQCRLGGFTLVELLVSLTILAILVGLLLPAVQAARESARQTQCTNNLRQIGLALWMHHDAHGHFPAGNFASRIGVCTGAAPTSDDNPSQDHANWAILILPYLDERPLFEQYDFSTYNEAVENRAVREASVAIYRCPSDQETTALTVPGLGPAAAWDLNVAYMPGSYRAVSGRSDGRQFLDDPLVDQYPANWRGPLHLVGILGFDRESARQIEDGTSHTLMVGESASHTQLEYRTLWAYSYAFYSLASTMPQSRTWWGDYERCRQTGGIGYGTPCTRSWGSYHAEGNYFVLCDGSVRFLSHAMDEAVFAAAGSIAGGENERLTDPE